MWMSVIGKEKVMVKPPGGTGFPRIDAVIASAEQTQDWDRAATASECYLYQLSSAMNLNIFEPFTEEQAALNAYLAAHMAGKRLCDYAWRLYAQSVT